MNELQEEISECLKTGIQTVELVQLVARAANYAETSDLESIKLLVYDEDLAPLAMVSLPAWGNLGIEKLIEFSFDDDLKLKTKTRAMEVAVYTSKGIVPRASDILRLSSAWDDYNKIEIDDNLIKFCLSKLRDRLFQAFNDEYEKSSFLLLLGTKAMMHFGRPEENRKDMDYLLSLIVDNQLILNSSIIANFENLINSKPKHEEDIQKVLTEHPVLLDPFVNELFSKQQLGNDFITDYVVRRTNNQYILVEIENSTDKLFNKNGSFSSSLTEAISQVRDFQAWVSDNLSYAQKKLPGIKHPEGLVVIGRSINLKDIEKKRLSEENYSRRGHIKIITYDELIETAKSVHRNIIEKPLVIKSKETKSI